MPASSELLSLAASYAALLVVPGPSFAAVLHASVAASRRSAMLTALGVASGAALLVAMVAAGASSLAGAVAGEGVGKALCAIVLMLAGTRAVRGALRGRGGVAAGGGAPGGSAGEAGRFGVGLLAALTNPVSFAFFASAALSLAPGDGVCARAVLPAGVFAMALAWFGFVAFVLSHPACRTAVTAHARPIGVAMGLALIALGLSMTLPCAP